MYMPSFPGITWLTIYFSKARLSSIDPFPNISRYKYFHAAPVTRVTPINPNNSFQNSQSLLSLTVFTLLSSEPSAVPSIKPCTMCGALQDSFKMEAP